MVYIDEVIFNGRTFKQMAFSNRGVNINVSNSAKYDGCEAVVAAIDERQGLIHYMQKKKSILKEDYEVFLREVVQRCPYKILVLQDNCSIHRSNHIADVMRELKIATVFNLPYR